MNDPIRATLTLLAIGFTATLAAAPDKASVQASSYDEASLAELVTDMVELQGEEDRLGKALTAKITEVLPDGPQSYGEFDWRTVFTVDYIAANAMDADKRQHAAVQLLVHPSTDDKFRKRYSEECHGYPAKRYNDKWIWVLVGRMEIRLSVMDKSMQSDATLDAIIGSFDLKKIETL